MNSFNDIFLSGKNLLEQDWRETEFFTLTSRRRTGFFLVYFQLNWFKPENKFIDVLLQLSGPVERRTFTISVPKTFTDISPTVSTYTLSLLIEVLSRLYSTETYVETEVIMLGETTLPQSRTVCRYIRSLLLRMSRSLSLPRFGLFGSIGFPPRTSP